ncbi:MAG: hypothetical protein MHM6MM_005920, partial [Cercozoa sp. M6MM]
MSKRRVAKQAVGHLLVSQAELRFNVSAYIKQVVLPSTVPLMTLCLLAAALWCLIPLLCERVSALRAPFDVPLEVDDLAASEEDTTAPPDTRKRNIAWPLLIAIVFSLLSVALCMMAVTKLRKLSHTALGEVDEDAIVALRKGTVLARGRRLLERARDDAHLRAALPATKATSASAAEALAGQCRVESSSILASGLDAPDRQWSYGDEDGDLHWSEVLREDTQLQEKAPSEDSPRDEIAVMSRFARMRLKTASSLVFASMEIARRTFHAAQPSRDRMWRSAERLLEVLLRQTPRDVAADLLLGQHDALAKPLVEGLLELLEERLQEPLLPHDEPKQKNGRGLATACTLRDATGRCLRYLRDKTLRIRDKTLRIRDKTLRIRDTVSHAPEWLTGPMTMIYGALRDRVCGTVSATCARVKDTWRPFSQAWTAFEEIKHALREFDVIEVFNILRRHRSLLRKAADTVAWLDTDASTVVRRIADLSDLVLDGDLTDLDRLDDCVFALSQATVSWSAPSRRRRVWSHVLGAEWLDALHRVAMVFELSFGDYDRADRLADVTVVDTDYASDGDTEVTGPIIEPSGAHHAQNPFRQEEVTDLRADDDDSDDDGFSWLFRICRVTQDLVERGVHWTRACVNTLRDLATSSVQAALEGRLVPLVRRKAERVRTRLSHYLYERARGLLASWRHDSRPRPLRNRAFMEHLETALQLVTLHDLQTLLGDGSTGSDHSHTGRDHSSDGERHGERHVSPVLSATQLDAARDVLRRLRHARTLPQLLHRLTVSVPLRSLLLLMPQPSPVEPSPVAVEPSSVAQEPSSEEPSSEEPSPKAEHPKEELRRWLQRHGERTPLQLAQHVLLDPDGDGVTALLDGFANETESADGTVGRVLREMWHRHRAELDAAARATLRRLLRHVRHSRLTDGAITVTTDGVTTDNVTTDNVTTDNVTTDGDTIETTVTRELARCLRELLHATFYHTKR